MTTIPRPRGHLLKILGVSFGVDVSVGQIKGSGILRAPAEIADVVPGIGLILWTLGAVQAAMIAKARRTHNRSALTAP